MKEIREILITFRKAIIIFLLGICVILLIPTIYGYFNQADLNNITDRKYKRENSQYLVTSISKDDYYYFDIYQDDSGRVLVDIYEKRKEEKNIGEVKDWFYLPNVKLKPQDISVEWEQGYLESGKEYPIAYLVVTIGKEELVRTPQHYSYLAK